MSVDAYCEAQGIKQIKFMKIDVEGAEALVLRGLARMLSERRVEQIYIEVEPDNLRSMGYRVEDMVQALEPARYYCYRLQSDGTPGRMVDLKEVGEANVLCMPADKR